MGFLSKLTSTAETTAGGRTPRERARRAKEIRTIEKGTRRWLNGGGWASRKDR
jgi:hypothetical protein